MGAWFPAIQSGGSFFFFHGVTNPSGRGPSHYRGFTIALRHTTIAGLLWTSDQLDAESSTWQHTTPIRDRHAHGGIRTLNLSKRAAADQSLRSRGPGGVSPMYTRTPSICPPLAGPRVLFCPRLAASCWCSLRIVWDPLSGVEWLAIMLRILKIHWSKFGPEVSHRHWGFLCIYSVPTEKFWDDAISKASSASFPIHYLPFPPVRYMTKTGSRI